MLKHIKIISSVCLALLGSTSLTFANDIPVFIYQKCGDTNHLIKNAAVYLVTPDGYTILPIDKEGKISIDEKFTNRPIQGFLATKSETILVGCYSAITNASSQQLILGAPGSICPKQSCHF